VSDEELQEGQDVVERDNSNSLEREIQESGKSTIGGFLAYVREKKRMSYEDIDKVTRIGPRWITAIENSEWSIYPSLIYAKGHIRGYSEMLGIDGNVLLQHFHEEMEKAFPDESFHVHPIQNFNQIFQPTSSKRDRSSKKGLAVFIGILILLFIFGLSRILHRHFDRNASLIPPPVANPGILTPENHPGAKTFTPSGESSNTQTPSGASEASSSLSNTVPVAGQNETINTLDGAKSQTAPIAQPGVSANGSHSSGSVPEQQKTPKALMAKKTVVPSDFRLKVVAVRDTWVGIQIDGTKEVKIPLDQGQWHIFHAKKSFRITTDDGGSLMLYLNAQKIGKAGDDDQPVYGRLISIKSAAPSP
jgi:cytoskeleton protein RodZ